MTFLDRFCAAELDGLESLFHANLSVEGPFVQCQSRAAYLESLKADPPEPSRYRIRRMKEAGDTVSVQYDYLKPSGSVRVEHRFRFVDERIAEMELTFDADGIS